jgi:spore germination protein (amino acid permease)
MKGKNNITTKQMALYTYVAQTGMGMISLPSMLAKNVGHDGWISVILAGIISIVLGSLIVVLMKRYYDKSIYDIMELQFGKIIAMIINLLLIVYLLLASAASIRVFGVFLRITILPKTPLLIIAPFSMLPSIFMVWCGLKTVVRFKYISTLSYVISLIYLLFIMEQYRFSFIMPIGEAGLPNILSGIRTSFFTFLGFELIAFLFAEITDRKGLIKWQVTAITLSMLYSTIIVLASTSLFGENFLKLHTIPLFNLSRVYHDPILERVDLYLIALWFVAMGCSMRAYMFTAYYSIHRVFKLKDSKGLLLIFFAVIILLSRIPRDVNEIFSFRYNMSLIGIGVACFFVFCLCLSFIRTKGVVK